MPCPCPSLDELLGLDSGAIDDPAFAALEAHLDDCGRCQGLLEEQLARAFPFEPIPAKRPADGSEAPPPPLPGFAIERELGRGGFGIVYLATRAVDGRQVALKYLGGGPADRARWRREAEAMRKLDLPGVVRLLDAREVGGWVCLVMEYVAGGNLEQRLGSSPSPETAARVAERLARTIAEVHETGLLHLDLKPSNLLLDGDRDRPLDDARLLVADFGLALPWGDSEATWTMAAGPRGTPSYMAPEQLAPDRATIGPAADLYAIGAILYRLLAGRPPFLAPTKPETYQLLRDRDPVSVRRLNPRVPGPLETICLACLRKDPARRYPSAEALADDLRRFLDGRPIVARPTPLPVLAARWCRRNRAFAGGLLAASALVVALVAGQSARLRASRVERQRVEREVARLEENLVLFSRVFSRYQDFAHSILFTHSSIEIDDLLGQLVPLRDRFQAAREAGTLDPANLVAFGQLNMMIVQLLGIRGQVDDETEAMVEDALGALEDAVRRAPHVDYFRQSLSEAKLMSLGIDVSLANFEHVEEETEAALELVRSMPPEALVRPSFRGIFDIHHTIALKRYIRGDLDSTLRALEEARVLNLEFDRSMPARGWLRNGGVSRNLAVTELALGHEEAAFARWASTPPEFGVLDPDVFLLGIGTRWFIYRLGPTVGLPDLGLIADPRWRGSPAEVADVIFEDADRLGLGAPMLLDSVRQAFVYACVGHRQAGNLPGADLAAGRLLGLALELTARLPDEPAARFMLAEAHQQSAKNGWKHDDPAAVRRGLILAIEATEEALALDPDDDDAYRRVLDERRRRLRELSGEEPDRTPRASRSGVLGPGRSTLSEPDAVADGGDHAVDIHLLGFMPFNRILKPILEDSEDRIEFALKGVS